MPSKTRPVCSKCGAQHFNFQGCAAAIGKSEKSGPPIEFRKREGEHDWHDLDARGPLGFGDTVAGFGGTINRKAPDGAQEAA
jgi:hypothetical protein